MRRLILIAAAALGIAACDPFAPIGYPPPGPGYPPPPTTGYPPPPGHSGGICGGLAGFQCRIAGDYCVMPDGQCRMPDAAGTCQPRPQVCTREYNPVCGCDGRTHPNPCEARAAGTSIAYPGQCR